MRHCVIYARRYSRTVEERLPAGLPTCVTRVKCKQSIWDVERGRSEISEKLRNGARRKLFISASKTSTISVCQEVRIAYEVSATSTRQELITRYLFASSLKSETSFDARVSLKLKLISKTSLSSTFLLLLLLSSVAPFVGASTPPPSPCLPTPGPPPPPLAPSPRSPAHRCIPLSATFIRFC